MLTFLPVKATDLSVDSDDFVSVSPVSDTFSFGLTSKSSLFGLHDVFDTVDALASSNGYFWIAIMDTVDNSSRTISILIWDPDDQSDPAYIRCLYAYKIGVGATVLSANGFYAVEPLWVYGALYQTPVEVKAMTGATAAASIHIAYGAKPILWVPNYDHYVSLVNRNQQPTPNTIQTYPFVAGNVLFGVQSNSSNSVLFAQSFDDFPVMHNVYVPVYFYPSQGGDLYVQVIAFGLASAFIIWLLRSGLALVRRTGLR